VKSTCNAGVVLKYNTVFITSCKNASEFQKIRLLWF
jgi:hypothetical protein